MVGVIAVNISTIFHVCQSLKSIRVYPINIMCRDLRTYHTHLTWGFSIPAHSGIRDCSLRLQWLWCLLGDIESWRWNWGLYCSKPRWVPLWNTWNSWRQGAEFCWVLWLWLCSMADNHSYWHEIWWSSNHWGGQSSRVLYCYKHDPYNCSLDSR